MIKINWGFILGAVVRESLTREMIFELRIPDDKEPGVRMPGKECLRQVTCKCEMSSPGISLTRSRGRREASMTGASRTRGRKGPSGLDQRSRKTAMI